MNTTRKREEVTASTVALAAQLIGDDHIDIGAVCAAAWPVDPYAVWLAVLNGVPDHTEWVAGNPYAPPDVLAAATRTLIERRCELTGAARNPSMPTQTLALIGRVCNSSYALGAVVVNPNAAVEVALACARRCTASTLLRLCGDPAVPTEVFRTFLYNENSAVVARAVRETADVEAIMLLYRHHVADVRCAVAINIATPPQVLTDLARDTVMRVRAYAVSNPGCPVTDVTRLAEEDPERIVRDRAKFAMNARS